MYFSLTDILAGQLPQNIALRLKQTGVNVLGTDPEQIDRAEDRHKFSSVLDSIGVDQPEWTEVTTLTAAKAFAEKVGCVLLSSLSSMLLKRCFLQLPRPHPSIICSLRRCDERRL